MPSKKKSSPSASGSATSFSAHSPRLVRPLAAHTSGHASLIVWQTKLSAAGVLNVEKKEPRKSAGSVRVHVRPKAI